MKLDADSLSLSLSNFCYFAWSEGLKERKVQEHFWGVVMKTVIS